MVRWENSDASMGGQVSDNVLDHENCKVIKMTLKPTWWRDIVIKMIWKQTMKQGGGDRNGEEGGSWRCVQGDHHHYLWWSLYMMIIICDVHGQLIITISVITFFFLILSHFTDEGVLWLLLVLLLWHWEGPGWLKGKIFPAPSNDDNDLYLDHPKVRLEQPESGLTEFWSGDLLPTGAAPKNDP